MVNGLLFVFLAGIVIRLGWGFGGRLVYGYNTVIWSIFPSKIAKYFSIN